MDSPAFRYRFGNGEFDEARFELSVAGLPVDVERRALEVLGVLLRHAGEVVTKAELLAEVWAGRVTVENVLPNAINKLRRALGEANAERIATVPRVGYRLDGPVTRTAVGRQLVSELALSAGQPVPGRPHFLLDAPLSSSSEVWRAVHTKTGEQRVYKFARDGERLRALKREVTLLRMLHEGLPDTRCLVEVLDWRFDEAPFFIECRYGGPNLADWAAAHLAGLSLEQRLALFLPIARAVSAAHGMGVLHKDLKPANVLVAGGPDAPHVRLTDFGSGHLLDPDRLAQLGITRMGLTLQEGAELPSGTPLYLAPELFEGQLASVRTDVFALGVMLYQWLAGRVGLPMAPGWEAQIEDELLRQDIAAATHGDPAQRLGSAAELVQRLEQLAARRSARRAERQAQEAAHRERAVLARAQARRPLLWGLVGVLLVATLVTLVLLWQAREARNQARQELDRANALTRFVTEDLIGRANPLVSAKGPDATLREVLLSARGNLAPRFAGQPQAGAAVHGSLATLFSAVDLFAEAEEQARRALDLLGTGGRASGPASIPARVALVRALARQSRLDDAARELQQLEQLVAQAPDSAAKQALSAARSSLLLARGDYRNAVPELRAALDGYDPADPTQAAQRDALRLDLITMLSQAQRQAEARAAGQAFIQELQARAGDHALTLALARLALVRAQEEDHAAAEQLLLQARPVIAARLGETHSRHITLLSELLGVAFRRADWPQAIGYAQQVHEVARRKFGDAHVSTHTTLVNWARTLDEAGQPQAALTKARAGHEALLKLAGPASPRTQDAAFLLALISLELGKPAAAEALLPQLDAAVLETFRPSGLWAPALQALRGMVLQQRGQPGAAPLLDAALQALKEEETLTAPSRLYQVTRQARARLPA
jgi:eukaryotic-like serine/threonine-protein kinase